jgi:uncharacterized protein YkwD
MKSILNQTFHISLFILFSFQIQAQCPPSKQSNVHVVQKGETLFGISKKYKISVNDLCTLNSRKASDPLPVCSNLLVKSAQKSTAVPTSYSQVTTKKKPVETSYDIPQRAAKGTHIVQSGENIADIARYYGYTEERFREFNLLSGGQEVEVGSVLLSTDCTCMQGGTADTQSSPTSETTETVPSSYSNDQTYNDHQPQQNSTPQLADNFEESTPTEQATVNTKSTASAPKSAEATTNVSAAGAPVLRKTLAAPYMKDEELSMTDEINLMRSNPTGYIKYIEEYIAEMRRDGEFGNSIQTAYELIDELKKTSKLSILEPMQCLYSAARKHGEDQRPTGDVNHQGRDGSWPWDRVLRECPQFKDGNENIVGGPSSVRKSVILLLVDDGIPNRGHRKTLLNPDWKYNACYKVGTVGDMPNCWVQKFGF